MARWVTSSWQNYYCLMAVNSSITIHLRKREVETKLSPAASKISPKIKHPVSWEVIGWDVLEQENNIISPCCQTGLKADDHNNIPKKATVKYVEVARSNKQGEDYAKGSLVGSSF